MMSSPTFNSFSIKPLTLSLAIAFASGFSLSANAESVYGPVKSSDTLSKIVNRIYTGSKSSRRSVMRQIVEVNPSAFLNGDMNHLKLNASLILPGDLWKDVPKSITPSSAEVNKASSTRIVTTDSVDRSAPDLSVEQMKGRIIFLDAERSSLIEQVAELKRETVRLEKKVEKLESDSKQSDEQLRILDAEIIRLSDLLKNTNNETQVSRADLNQLVVLQEKLRLVQEETKSLRSELLKTQSKLKSNDNTSSQANQTIAQLTQENSRLQKILKDSQPGVHYYNDSNNDYKLSLMSGKLQLPLGLIVVGGALAALMLTALVVTRRKKKPPQAGTETQRIDPFEENPSAYSTLLETQTTQARGFAQSHTQPEENVFKMFDEGSLEMDLKLDMAEAYLQVSDFKSARTILQEVIQGGSELQKRTASRLINKAA